MPVKIVLDRSPSRALAAGLLRPGMSVEPTIDTKAGRADYGGLAPNRRTASQRTCHDAITA